MPKTRVNKQSTWPVLDEALGGFSNGGAAAVPDGAFTVIADRVRTAIEGSEHKVLGDTAVALERFYRSLLAVAPPQARAAARSKGDPNGQAAYLLGQAAFAHRLAARTFDLRVDDDFLRLLDDKRYQSYLRALLTGPKDGVKLGRAAGEAKETVSRKLSILRGRGVVTSHKEGTAVVNSLSPAALAFFKHHGVEGEQQTEATAGSAAVAEARAALPGYLRSTQSFAPRAEPARPARAA